MPRTQLTTKLARHHPAPEYGKTQLFDTQLTGLMVEIRPSGGRTFYLRYQDAQNKTRQLRLAKAQELSISQAREKARAVLADIRMGNDPHHTPEPAEQPPTLREFVERQYLPFVRHYKKSHQTDELLLRIHLLPRFAELRMDEIRRYDVQCLLQELTEDYQPATVERILIVLRYAYNLALRWEVPGVSANPAHKVDAPKVHNKQERYLTNEELRRLLKALETSHNRQLKPIVTMLLLTGARRSEVLHARWQDFDFEHSLWRIPQPKATERRHVPLSSPALDMLEHLESRGKSDFLFPNPRTGCPFHGVFNAWNSARKRAGLADLRLHDLRHSFASFLVNSGHSLYEVQRLLGHTQIKTTQRYAHLSEERLLEASNDVGRLISSAYPNPEEPRP